MEHQFHWRATPDSNMKDLIEYLRKEEKFYKWLASPAANSQEKMHQTWRENSKVYGQWADELEKLVTSSRITLK